MVSKESIFTTCFIFLFLLGAFLPYARNAFPQSGDVASINDKANVENLISTESAESLDNNSAPIGAISILVSIITMFFWTFGGVPFWIDSILLIVRIMLVISIAHMIRGG